MKIKTDQTGVDTLKALAESLPTAYEAIETAGTMLRSSFDEKRQVLGPHQGQIESILEDINSAQSTGKTALISTCTVLLRSAATLQEIINKQFGGSSSNP